MDNQAVHDAQVDKLHKEYVGLKKGIEEGRAQGEAKDRAEGLQEGEKRKAIEMERKMLKRGMPLEEVAGLCDLDYTKIKQLSHQVNYTLVS